MGIGRIEYMTAWCGLNVRLPTTTINDDEEDVDEEEEEEEEGYLYYHHHLLFSVVSLLSVLSLP